MTSGASCPRPTSRTFSSSHDGGMMKIPMADMDKVTPINEPVKETAGLKYETLKDVTGVEQLDRLNYDNALLLVKGEGGMSLKTMALP